MSVTPAQIAEWSAAVGRSEERAQLLDVESLRRFSLACGLQEPVGGAVPALAHWAWFLPAAPDSGLGEDGHPLRGGFMPPVSLPRRMFAGAVMQFVSPLVVGEPGQLMSSILNVRHRGGRSGDLVFVEVQREIRQNDVLAVREVQTIVYREDAPPQPLPAETIGESRGEIWTPRAVNLFRFSAVTFNAHRIHYDQAYAKSAEGYPALVVHGPFTAVKLAALASSAARRPLASFEFKGLAPLFVDQPIRLIKGLSDGEFCAVRCDGVVAMTARVTYQ